MKAISCIGAFLIGMIGGFRWFLKYDVLILVCGWVVYAAGLMLFGGEK